MNKYTLSNLEFTIKEALKEIKKHNTYVNELENENILYKQEIERLKESEEYHRKGYAELYRRIDEATEYIAENLAWRYQNKFIDELIEILQGDDKE